MSYPHVNQSDDIMASTTSVNCFKSRLEQMRNKDELTFELQFDSSSRASSPGQTTSDELLDSKKDA